MPDFRALLTEAFGPRAKLETSKDPGEMSSSAFFVGSADEPPAAALAGCDTGVSAAPSVGAATAAAAAAAEGVGTGVGNPGLIRAMSRSMMWGVAGCREPVAPPKLDGLRRRDREGTPL